MTPIQSTGSSYPTYPLTSTQSSLIQEGTSVNIKHEQSQEKLKIIEESLKEILPRLEESKVNEETSSRLSAIFSVLNIFLAKILFDTERYTKAFELIKQIAEQQKGAAVYYSSSRMNATDDIDKWVGIFVIKLYPASYNMQPHMKEKLFDELPLHIKAELFDKLLPYRQEELFDKLPSQMKEELFDELPPHMQAELFDELSSHMKEELFDELPPHMQAELLKKAMKSQKILTLLKGVENTINNLLPASTIDLKEKLKSAIEDMKTYLVKEVARSEEKKARLAEENARLAKARKDLAEKNFLDCVIRQLRAKEVEGADAESKLAYIIDNNKNKIKRLYLNRIQLNNLPNNIMQYIGQFSYLKDLSLTHNELHDLPQELEKLRCLKYLDISNNYLSRLPSFITLLSKLKDLNISHNSFQTFPRELLQMRFLEFLDFSHNKIEKIDFDCRNSFFHLEVLNLSYNKLEDIPDNLWNSHTLKSLDISNNKVQNLSAKIKKCLHLEALYLSSNSLESPLPEKLWECRHLKRLDLTNNKISRLPENISSSSPLVQLYLSNNILLSLPEGLKNFKQLKELYVKNNRPSITIEIQNEIKQQLEKTQVVFS